MLDDRAVRTSFTKVSETWQNQVDAESSKVSKSPVDIQEAFRKCVLNNKRLESALKANNQTLGDDLSNHRVAAGIFALP